MRRLFAAYRREYARAYDMLHAARLVSPGGIPGVLTAEAKARVRERAEAFAEKAVHRSETEYEKRRFLSAYTCRGAVLLSETAASFGRVYTLDNELGLADDFLQAVLERARSAGAARIVCPDPVDPEKLAALILPEDGLSLVAVSGDFRFDGQGRAALPAGRGGGAFRRAAKGGSAAPPRCAVRSRRRRVPRCGGRRSCTTNWRRHIIRLWISER